MFTNKLGLVNYIDDRDKRLVFISHPELKQKLCIVKISKKQYYTLLRILQDLGILKVNLRGVWYKSIGKYE